MRISRQLDVYHTPRYTAESRHAKHEVSNGHQWQRTEMQAVFKRPQPHSSRTASILPSNSREILSRTFASAALLSCSIVSDHRWTMTGSGLRRTRSSHSQGPTSGAVAAEAKALFRWLHGQLARGRGGGGGGGKIGMTISLPVPKHVATQRTPLRRIESKVLCHGNDVQRCGALSMLLTVRNGSERQTKARAFDALACCLRVADAPVLTAVHAQK